MLDIHSHLLFDLDDGAIDIQESVNIIKMAKSIGFEGMIATPHYKQNEYCQTPDNIIKRIDAIKFRLKQEDIKFNIYIGNEIYIFPEMCEFIQNGDIAKLNNSRYILVETPRQEKVLYLEDILFKIRNRGYVPILAHPERYEYIQKDIKYAKKLVQSGVLLQINAGSLIEMHGKKAKSTAKKLLKNSLVSFVATDCHRVGKMYFEYENILKKIKKIVGEERYNKIIFDNPRRVRDNLEIV